MKRRFNGQTDQGVVRSYNQDSFHEDPKGRFFIVADGMGGHAGGQEASKIAIEKIKAYLKDRWDSDDASDDLLKEAIALANQGIIDDQLNNPERGDMGTTVVAVLFREDNVWYSNIGDSRLYRLRGEELDQITEDQTWVAQAVKAGEITKEQARMHPWRHVLSQCLGREDMQAARVKEMDVVSGDRLLLCSDGLTEEVPDEKINSYLQSSSDCAEIAHKLIEAAKQAGGSDNITVIIVAVE